jgi:hypothetical protein
MTNIDGPRNVRHETVVEPQVASTVPAAPAQQVVAQPVVAQPVPVVAQPVVAAPTGVAQATSLRRFAPDAIIAAGVGLIVLIMGLLAIVRGGFDGPMEEPVVEVLGFSHTTTLGLIEVVVGGLLLICGASSWRSGALFFGSVLAIGSFVGAVQTESFSSSLALESSHAWLGVVGGVLVVLSALLMPRFTSRTTDVRAM